MPEKAIKISKEKKKNSPLFEQEGELVIDVFETEDNIIIQSAIAGINTDDLEISIEKDMLSIKGTRERKTEEIAKNYYCQECYWGRFSREVILPVETESTKADAAIRNGILTITIPKVHNREKNKKLNIKNVE
jgi:HSP20 family protein